MNRGDAVAETLTFRGRRVAPSPRFVSTEYPRGSRGVAAVRLCGTCTSQPRSRRDSPRRGYSVETSRGRFGLDRRARLRYDDVVASARRYIPASKIVMGFYPGFQAYTGEWCGIEHDKATISHLDGETGGIMFWAANRPARASNGRSVAQNSNELAAFAADL